MTRRSNNYARHHSSPLNSGLWILIELVVNVRQIIAAIVVVSLAGHEHPKTPLFAWIIGYTAGCFATLPYIYWLYIHRNGQASEQDLYDSLRSSSLNNYPGFTSYTSISLTQASEGKNDHSNALSLT